MKQSAWYCLRIASTVGSRGPTALWQKAQMSAGGDEEGLASASPAGDEPAPSPCSPLEPSLSRCPLASCHGGLSACSWRNLGGLSSAGKAEGAW